MHEIFKFSFKNTPTNISIPYTFKITNNLYNNTHKIPTNIKHFICFHGKKKYKKHWYIFVSKTKNKKKMWIVTPLGGPPSSYIWTFINSLSWPRKYHFIHVTFYILNYQYKLHLSYSINWIYQQKIHIISLL
jgi:hypothetical protein